MRRTLCLLTAAVVAFSIAGCGPAQEPSSEASAPPERTGTWAFVSTVTPSSAPADPTIKELDAFINQVIPGGTLTVEVPASGSDPGYTTTASGDGERYYAVTTMGGEASFAAGDGRQYCAAGPLPSGSEPSVSDWSCKSGGSPSGGSEFDILAGWGWMLQLPSAWMERSSSATIEKDSGAYRVTFETDDGAKVVEYDPAAGTVVQTDPAGPFGILTFSPELPQQWPDLPPISN